MSKISTVLPEQSENYVIKLLIHLFLCYNFYFLISVFSVRLDEVYGVFYTSFMVMDIRNLSLLLLILSSSVIFIGRYLLEMEIHNAFRWLIYGSLVALISDFHHGLFGDVLLKKNFQHDSFVFLQVALLGYLGIPIQYKIINAHVNIRRKKMMLLGGFIMGSVSFLLTQLICFHEDFFYFSLHALPILVTVLFSLILDSKD